jgi:hypothetical protein
MVRGRGGQARRGFVAYHGMVGDRAYFDVEGKGQTMARFAQAIVVGVLVVGALHGAASVAAANPVTDYRDVMRSFLPELQSWAGDTSQLIVAAQTKPELGCSEEMAALAQHGVWVSQDMAGTAAMAPRALASTHEKVAAAMFDLTEAAQSSCADSVGAAARAQQAYESFRRALVPIVYFVEAPQQRAVLPAPPVSGN